MFANISLDDILENIKKSEAKFRSPTPPPTPEPEPIEEPEDGSDTSDESDDSDEEPPPLERINFYTKTVHDIIPNFTCDPETIEQNLTKLRKSKSST